MPLNPHIKGGPDVPVPDGGTGASDAASALGNLGGIDETAHDILDHTGLMGVGDLTTLAHGSLDHSMIPGVSGSPNIIHQSNPNFSIANAVNPGGYNLVIPAATLTTDGDELLIKVVLAGTSAGSESINVSLGGISLLANAIFGATANPSFTTFFYRFYRTGAATARFIGVHEEKLDVPSVTRIIFNHSHVGSDSIAVTWANPLTFNMTNVNATVNVVRSVQAIKYPQVP